MLRIKMLIALILIVTGTSAAKELVKFTLSSYILPNKELTMELDVVTPRTPGHYPVMLFLTGLSGLAPSIFQEHLIESVAEEGYVWMTVHDLQFRSQGCKAPILRKLLKPWVKLSSGSMEISSRFSIAELQELLLTLKKDWY